MSCSDLGQVLVLNDPAVGLVKLALIVKDKYGNTVPGLDGTLVAELNSSQPDNANGVERSGTTGGAERNTHHPHHPP